MTKRLFVPVLMVVALVRCAGEESKAATTDTTSTPTTAAPELPADGRDIATASGVIPSEARNPLTAGDPSPSSRLGMTRGRDHYIRTRIHIRAPRGMSSFSNTFVVSAAIISLRRENGMA